MKSISMYCSRVFVSLCAALAGRAHGWWLVWAHAAAGVGQEQVLHSWRRGSAHSSIRVVPCVMAGE